MAASSFRRTPKKAPPATRRTAHRAAAPRRPATPKDPAGARATAEIARQLLKVYRLVEVRASSVLEEAQARGLRVDTLEDLRAIPIEKRDALATTFIKTAKIWATSNGASLGAAGMVTIAADVAALVAVNLRLIQHVCLTYGLPTAVDRVDAWALLLAALGEEIDVAAIRATPPGRVRAVTEKLVEDTARTFTKRLLGGRGAGRSVPLVGAVFGGVSNYAYTVEVGTRAREFYRSIS